MVCNKLGISQVCNGPVIKRSNMEEFCINIEFIYHPSLYIYMYMYKTYLPYIYIYICTCIKLIYHLNHLLLFTRRRTKIQNILIGVFENWRQSIYVLAFHVVLYFLDNLNMKFSSFYSSNKFINKPIKIESIYSFTYVKDYKQIILSKSIIDGIMYQKIKIVYLYFNIIF